MRNTRGLRALAIFGLVCVWPSLGVAQQRIVVGEIHGPQAKSVRAAVEATLEKHDIDVVTQKQAEAMARRSGAELDSESGRVRVGKRMHVQAFIEGQIHIEKKHKLRIIITVFNASDGMESGEFTVSAAKPAVGQKLQAGLWPVVDSALRGSSQPAAAAPIEETPIAAAPARAPTPARAPAPAPESKKPVRPERELETPTRRVAQEDEADEKEEQENPEALALAETADQGQAEQAGERPSPLELSLMARFGTRNFGYNDSLGGLRGYSLGISPAAALHLHWYPVAHFSAGVLANIGLDLRGDLMFGVSSKNSAGQKFATGSHAFGVGLRGRLPLKIVELGAVAGFGQHAFTIANYKKIDPDIPDVVYSFVRVGLDGRVQPANWFAVQLRAAFLFGLSTGEIASAPWFPHTTGNGVEADLALSFRIAPLLWLEGGFGMQRYFMSLNPLPSDRGVRGAGRVAGGALDQYFSGKLGVSLRL